MAAGTAALPLPDHPTRLPAPPPDNIPGPTGPVMQIFHLYPAYNQGFIPHIYFRLSFYLRYLTPAATPPALRYDWPA